jgi:hypothetical protein
MAEKVSSRIEDHDAHGREGIFGGVVEGFLDHFIGGIKVNFITVGFL